MEKMAHMRLSGHTDAFPLAPPAHDRLLRYLAEACSALGAVADGDETVRDLEATIGERLRALRDDHGRPVEDAQMAHVLSALGSVETNEPSAGAGQPAARGPFWCRVNDGKWFGGICLGIAARGSFRVEWLRTVAILLLMLTGGLLGIAYLALLLFLPPVTTVAEYRRLCDTPRPQS